MKAIVLTGISRMEMRDVPDPRIEADTDVLLGLSTAGVCGSDIHYYRNGRIGSQVVDYPFIPGHECSCVVVDTGKAVSRVKRGDRVAVDPATFCGRCEQCLAGRHNTCLNLRFLGCPGQGDGCLSEYIVMHEACCYPVDKEMSMEQAALAEPLSIGLYSAKQFAEIRDAKVGVLGCGPIGLSVLLCVRALGCGTAYATDRINERLDAASLAGADWTGNPDNEDITASICEREPMLLDAVFECCGKQEAIDQAVNLLKPGGSLVIVGAPEAERVSFVIDTMRRRELSVQNIRRQRECLRPALDMMTSGEINCDFMVTHRFGFDRTKNAFDLVADYRDGVIKAMIEF